MLFAMTAFPVSAGTQSTFVKAAGVQTAHSRILHSAVGTRLYNKSEYPVFVPHKYQSNIADGSTNYGYSQLSDKQKQAYSLLKQAAKAKSAYTRIYFKSFTLTLDELTQAYNYFFDDNPQFFWISHNFYYYGNDDDSEVDSVMLESVYTKSEDVMDTAKVNSVQKQINSTVKVYLNAVKNAKDPYSKELILHDLIIRNTVYDNYDIDNYKESNHSIEGPFVKKTAVCDGYARSFQYLLNLCGVEAIYVSDIDHAWIKAKINGLWYNVDDTWDDIENDDGTDWLLHEYFNLTDEEIAEDHDSFSPVSELYITPECTSNKDNYYIRTGRSIKTTDNLEQTMVNIIVNSIKKGNYSVDIKASDSTVYQNMHDLFLQDGCKTDLYYQVIKDVASKLDVSLRTSSYPTFYGEDDTNVIIFNFFHVTGSVDKTDLMEKIMYAKCFYSSSADFSKTSYASFKSALSNAQKVVNDKKASQTSVNTATKTLAKAINNLAMR